MRADLCARRDLSLCWNQLHPRQEGGCRPCHEAWVERKRLAREAKPRPLTPQRVLWVNDGEEYWFLRHTLGLTPEEIAAKHGVRWESFQRTLHRRVGGKASW
jgi:hypothetical protein